MLKQYERLIANSTPEGDPAMYLVYGGEIAHEFHTLKSAQDELRRTHSNGHRTELYIRVRPVNPHIWELRPGEKHVFDCRVCGAHTGNLPLYVSDECRGKE